MLAAPTPHLTVFPPILDWYGLVWDQCRDLLSCVSRPLDTMYYLVLVRNSGLSLSPESSELHAPTNLHCDDTDLSTVATTGARVHPKASCPFPKARRRVRSQEGGTRNDC